MDYFNEIWEYIKKAEKVTGRYLDENILAPDEYKDLMHNMWSSGFSVPAIVKILSEGWEKKLKQAWKENQNDKRKFHNAITHYVYTQKENPNFSGKKFANACKKFLDKYVEEELEEQRKKQEHSDFLKNRTKRIRFLSEDVELIKYYLQKYKQDERIGRILKTLDGTYKVR